MTLILLRMISQQCKLLFIIVLTNIKHDMKRILFFLIAAATTIACSKEDGRITDPNAKLSLRPAAGVTLKAGTPTHLTAYEIVKRTTSIAFINEKVYNLPLSRGFGDDQRDFVNNRLLLFATDVINSDGSLKLDFIEGKDFVLREMYFSSEINTNKIDTVAYLPNSVVRDAETAIKAAYNSGNYKECYRLMDEAFRFTPITGAEWRVLKEEGKN